MTDKELEQIYNESYKAVYWTAMSLLKNEADAEDVVQDTFISLIESYGNMTDLSGAVALLKKIAANKCLDRIKLARTDAVENEFFEDVEALPEDFLPDTIIESEEMRKVIMNIINNVLSDEIRRTLILFYFDDMSSKEIADVLGIPQGTVLWRLSFAKQKIKKEVEKYEKDNDTKLFSMVMIPFFTQLFTKEAEQTVFRPMPANLLNLSASPQASSPEAGIQTAKEAVGKGTGKSMKKLFIGSIAASVAVGVFLGVTLGIVVRLKNSNSTNTPDQRNERNYNNDDNNGTDNPSAPDDEDDAYVPSENYPSDSVTGYKKIKFGKYRDMDIDWLILEENEQGMLLLSTWVLEGRQFNVKNTTINWENCTLRKWLNDEFYNSAFSAEEKQRVLMSAVENPESPKRDAKPGSITNDHVFLLSYPEAKKYFYLAREIQARHAPYLSRKDLQNVEERRANCAWWLRTPGYSGKTATAVGYTGTLDDNGNYPETTMGVRPAIWISYKPLKDGEKPVPTSSPEQLKQRNVTVEDAFRQQFETDDPDEPVINRYPKVTISGVDTSEINRKMKHELKRKLENPVSGEAVDYQYYVSDNIVSIIAMLTQLDSEKVDYKIYNISKATGREVYGRQLVNESGMSQEIFLNTAKSLVNKAGRGPDDTPKEIKRRIVDINKERMTFGHLRPFYSTKGHLCFVSAVSYVNSDGEEKTAHMAFDAEKNKKYDWSRDK